MNSRWSSPPRAGRANLPAGTCRPGPADRRTDTGRIFLGCSNPDCDVIGMEVLVMRDGTPWTHDRDDISSLEGLVPRRGGTQVGGITALGPEVHR